MTGYIYRITNLINNKVYIGKTLSSIERRFEEHLRDAKRTRCNNRPLYKAINKYGEENFIIEEVERVVVTDGHELSDREVYWINFYDSYKNGYNATLGGDGSPYLDYDLIIDTYKKVQCVKETAALTGCSRHSVSAILRNASIEIKTSYDILKENTSKQIFMCDLDNNHLQTFESIGDAVRFIGKPHDKQHRGAAGKISLCARGERKTAYGYIWHFA